MSWWLKEPRLRFFSLEFTGTEYGPNMKGLDVSAIAEAAQRMQVNVLVAFALGHHGVAYYPSRVFPRHKRLGRRNIVGELLRACRGLGIRFMTYNCAHDLGVEALRRHPEWATRPRGAAAADGACGGRPVCVNTPFLDAFLEAVREVVQMGVDGMFFDGIGTMGSCVCPGCRRSFRMFSGRSLLAADEGLIARWAQAQLRAIAQRYHQTVKEINPDCFFFVNGLGADAAIEFNDGVGAEAFFGLRGRFLPPLNDTATVARVTQGCCRLGQVPIVYSRYAQSPWAHHTNTDAELELATYRSVAAGAHPWYSGYDTGFFGYPEGQSAIGRANAFVRRAAPFLAGDSDDARVLVIEREESVMEVELFTEAFRGFTEALTRHRIPWHAAGLSHVNLDKLRGYDLVVIPGKREVAEETLRTLAEYAYAGGNLILTGETGFANADGRPRRRLPAVFGYQPTGRPEYRCRKYQVFNLAGYIMPAAGSGDVLGDLSERPVIPCVFRASRVRPAKGSRVVAWLEDRDTNTAYSRFLGPARDPAILLNARGNALYVSADVDATYHINRGAVGGELIRRLVRRFLGQDCCLCTNAPESVEITVRRQVAQGRTVIHLVNATSAAIRPIEDLVPVRDITVSLPAERPGRVFSLRGRPVHWTCRGGMLRVCLDRLDLYDLIVIETQ